MRREEIFLEDKNLMRFAAEMANASVVEHLQNHPNVIISSDGIPFCSICGESLVEAVEAFRDVDSNFYIPAQHLRRSCKCQREEEAIKNAEKGNAEKSMAIWEKERYCFRNAKRLVGLTMPNNTPAPLVRAIEAYISEWKLLPGEYVPRKEFPDYGLCLWGNNGTGKTTLAAVIANAILSKGDTAKDVQCGFDVAFLRAGNMIAAMSNDRDREENVEAIQFPHLLVIDDVGADSMTDTKRALLYEVLDTRELSGKPMIVTTNIPKSALDNPRDDLEQRIFSRLKSLLWLKVDGQDHRNENGKTAAATLRDRVLET